jgi:hypothetical protein
MEDYQKNGAEDTRGSLATVMELIIRVRKSYKQDIIKQMTDSLRIAKKQQDKDFYKYILDNVDNIIYTAFNMVLHNFLRDQSSLSEYGLNFLKTMRHFMTHDTITPADRTNLEKIRTTKRIIKESKKILDVRKELEDYADKTYENIINSNEPEYEKKTFDVERALLSQFNNILRGSGDDFQEISATYTKPSAEAIAQSRERGRQNYEKSRQMFQKIDEYWKSPEGQQRKQDEAMQLQQNNNNPSVDARSIDVVISEYARNVVELCNEYNRGAVSFEEWLQLLKQVDNTDLIDPEAYKQWYDSHSRKTGGGIIPSPLEAGINFAKGVISSKSKGFSKVADGILGAVPVLGDISNGIFNLINDASTKKQNDNGVKNLQNEAQKSLTNHTIFKSGKAYLRMLGDEERKMWNENPPEGLLEYLAY